MTDTKKPSSLSASKGGKTPIHILSLGAGVQSSTLALMACFGEVNPMPVCGIFADTQSEPQSVYDWLTFLQSQLPFPVYRVTRGSLYEQSTQVIRAKGRAWTRHSVPAFLFENGKKTGLAMRQCTRDFKLRPIIKEMNRVRKKAPVIQWIGISSDEVYRMKPAREKWLTSRWPLVEMNLSREDCLKWLHKKGFPMPPRSACSFCPYHSDSEWLRLKEHEPKAFTQAVNYEKEFQSAIVQGSGFRGMAFLHKSGNPLSEVVFRASAQTPNAFNNECEGLCGV